VTLRIGTYNIHRTVGTDGRADESRIARVVREIDADVLALQEVGYRPQERGHVLESLCDAMGARVVEGITLRDERGHYGNAVLSRVPIREVRRFDISVARREPRGAIEVLLEAPGTTLQIVATHLGLRPVERRHQVRKLLQIVETLTAPTRVLLGDLNEWFLWGRPIRWLHRAFEETPALPTFPAHRPLFALDRLWVAPSASLRRIYVHDSETARLASDHLPLVGELGTGSTFKSQKILERSKPNRVNRKILGLFQRPRGS
jgi:endonuclease/exonuclease/phosphatase family metal-dependent hydrolase